MTDEELIGKVTHVWSENVELLYRIVLREHENGFSKTMLKIESKQWVTLKHRIFVTQEISHG